jgi:hypothetical protein
VTVLIGIALLCSFAVGTSVLNRPAGVRRFWPGLPLRAPVGSTDAPNGVVDASVLSDRRAQNDSLFGVIGVRTLTPWDMRQLGSDQADPPFFGFQEKTENGANIGRVTRVSSGTRTTRPPDSGDATSETRLRNLRG